MRPIPTRIQSALIDTTASAASGLAVAMTVLHPAWAPLQIPALALFGARLLRAEGFFGHLRPGFWFGATLAGVSLFHIGIPENAAAILLIGLTGYWMLLGAGLARLLRATGPLAPLGAAGLLTLGEWAQSTALPLFGTAQRFGGAWVDYAAALTISRVSGTLGITFCVGLIAFTLAKMILPHRRENGETYRVIFTFDTISLALLTPIGLAAAFGMITNLGETHGASRDITVAACGTQAGGPQPIETFLATYLPMVETAAAQGARLVVTPELALFTASDEEDATLARVAGEARRLGVAWAVGYATGNPSRNRAALLNADRPVGAPYDKTHLVTGLEAYDRRGTGAAVTGELSGKSGYDAKVGLMICQDDNFEDVARNLSLAGVQVAAVPTFDWRGVEFAHLNSARNRPREFDFVSVRAAVGGISAILDSTGRVVAERNHLVEGDGPLVTSVTLSNGGPTLFARFGNIPTLTLAGLLVDTRRRRVSSPADACENTL